MSTDATFTFRVDEELKSQFSSAAKANDRTGAQLLRAFMRDFVKHQQTLSEHDAWFRQQVQLGLDSANAGRLVPNEQVEAEFAVRRAETARKLGIKL
jgi:predicted transcriptional regulator